MNNYLQTGLNVRDKNPYALLALGDKLCQTKMSVPLCVNSAWKLKEKSGEFQNTTNRKEEEKQNIKLKPEKIRTELKRRHFTD